MNALLRHCTKKRKSHKAGGAREKSQRITKVTRVNPLANMNDIHPVVEMFLDKRVGWNA